MAGEEEREKPLQEVADITSEENSIDEDELELTLGLRPIHCRHPPATFQKLPELSDPFHDPQNAAICPKTLSKRDALALRRLEARKKRDLKRKANYHQNNNHMAWLRVEERKSNEEEGEGDRCCKAVRMNSSYWAPPSWWSWNPEAAYGGGAGGGFRPYQGQNGKIPAAGQNVEGRDGENRQSISSGSSSGISDNYQSTSGQGGNNSSTDTGSHSGQSHPQLPEPITFQTQPSSSSCNQTKHVTSSTHSASKSPKGVSSSSTTVPEGVPASDQGGPTKGETTGKPPKPNGQTSQQKVILSQMPCVSATGNGPNGKTITGFLYRYSKAEVSIVCVCHGASFSPAGFVEHAGGVDVEHPLRHIRVVPFAFS